MAGGGGFLYGLGMAGPTQAEGVSRREVVRVTPEGALATRADLVAVEEPLEIRVDGETLAVTMRTPGQDGDLALGFLYAEGVIGGPDDVGSVSHCGRPGDEGYGNVVDVRSAGGHRIDPGLVLEGTRWAATTSACGVCGRRTIEGLLSRVSPVDGGARLTPAALLAAMERLSSSQPIFRRTGGLHAAVAFAADGAVLAAAEDIGRHNAVDKVVGALLRLRALGVARPEGAAPALLAVSGRAGFEIVQKAAAARIPIVSSVSAPSSLAVDLAHRAGVTLVGFARGQGFNVYANTWRIEEGRAAARPSP